MSSFCACTCVRLSLGLCLSVCPFSVFLCLSISVCLLFRVRKQWRYENLEYSDHWVIMNHTPTFSFCIVLYQSYASDCLLRSPPTLDTVIFVGHRRAGFDGFRRALTGFDNFHDGLWRKWRCPVWGGTFTCITAATMMFIGIRATKVMS